MVRERGGLEYRVDADRTADFVLQVLVDRLTGDQARDLLGHLPTAPFSGSIVVTEPPMAMTADEFVEIVAHGLRVTSEEARRRIEAVFTALRDAVTPGVFHHLLAELPSGFVELLLVPAPA